jgi:DNA-binding IclR family transcriptional regulator
MPLYAGASGKVLLAFGPEELSERIIRSKKLKAITASTITDPDVLEREIISIKEKGYAISKGENVTGANAIAAPVMDYNQKLIGAIGIAAPTNRLNDENIEARVELVKATAIQMSKKFGYISNTKKIWGKGKIKNS